MRIETFLIVPEDFCFLGWFELGGFEGREIEDQMQLFAEEVMPQVRRQVDRVA